MANSGEGSRTNADERGLPHRAITERVIGAFYEVYDELGSGFLESVYEGAMTIVLRERGLRAIRQPPLAVRFRGQTIGEVRPDLVVDDVLILELKAARTIETAHEAQLLNYLRASDLEVGLLFTFGPKASFRRFGFSNDRKRRPRWSAFVRGPIPRVWPPGPSTA
jgi:GxxExxY protein